MTWHDVARLGMWRKCGEVWLECAWGDMDMSWNIVVIDVMCVRM